MKTVITSSVFFLLALLVPLHGAEGDKPSIVIVFGDSITAGRTKMPLEQQWLHMIERDSKGALKTINEGKGGRPTSSRPEFGQMLQRHKQADILVIALGMNDSRDLSDSCVPKAVENLRSMIEKARLAYGPSLRILLVGPSNINKGALGPTKPIANEREARLRDLGVGFAKLAMETKCEFVSLFGVIPNEALTSDGVHPDAVGNAAIAKFLLPKLVP